MDFFCQIFNIIFRIIKTPIEKYLISFFFLSILLFLPEVFTVVAHDRITYVASHLLTNCTIYVLISYSACLIFLIFHKYTLLENIIIFIFHTLFYTFSIGEVYLVKTFGTQVNSTILQIISETTSTEINGFISTYLTDPVVLKISALFLCVLIVEILFSYLYYNHNEIFSNVIKRIFYLLFIIYLISYSFSKNRFFSKDYINNQIIADLDPIKDNSIWHLSQAYLQFKDNQSSLLVSAKYQEQIIIDTCTFLSDNIIIIIGESYNKHHSSLYGYYLETNPRLEQMKKNLYIFSDVISSYNLTSDSFRNFMSFSSIDDSLQWFESPLFPAVFKKAGYNVSFYSNQFVKQVNMSVFNAAAGFFSHPAIEPYLFNERNNSLFKYDEDLIEQYKKDKDAVEKEHKNLTIFHLRGQHFNPATVVPRDFRGFTINDLDRLDLSAEQKQQVVDYDNATLYNDSIVSEIIEMYKEKDAIVIYFADHGEEANDFRPFVGRSFDFAKEGAPCVHAQLDVPFLVYVSDIYKEKHPEIISQLEKSINRPFETDDLPHLLVYLAGIDFNYYDSTRNILSNDFNNNRNRIIDKCFLDYDEIISTK